MREQRLTPRQQQVLNLTARGRTSREIAALLGISVYTVNHYLDAARERLGSVSRADAVARYLRATNGDGPAVIDLREGQPRGLTARQIEVFAHLAAGSDVDDIAERLNLSPHTVRTHIWRIMLRLGARSQQDAVRRFFLAAEGAGEPGGHRTIVLDDDREPVIERDS